MVAQENVCHTKNPILESIYYHGVTELLHTQVPDNSPSLYNFDLVVWSMRLRNLRSNILRK